MGHARRNEGRIHEACLFRSSRADFGPGSPRSDRVAHRGDIQGLRAVAVLLVALDHAGIPFLRGGYVGVDVFFVLSGFLITGMLLSQAMSSGRVSLADFYVRRARRILPAAVLTLVATSIAAHQLLNFVRAKDVVEDSIWASCSRPTSTSQPTGATTSRRPSPRRRFCISGRSRSKSSSTSSGRPSSRWCCSEPCSAGASAVAEAEHDRRSGRALSGAC